MNILLVGDGTKWIDLDKAEAFDLGGFGHLFRSPSGDWVHKQPSAEVGQNIAPDGAFRLLIQSKLFDAAERYFSDKFKGGEL
jgi:hypothetical protein